MILFLAVAIVGLIGAGSLAVDIGMGLVAKAELQNVADASALSGTRELAQIYIKDPRKISGTLNDSDQRQVRDSAKEYAALNKAGGISISVPTEDLLLGKYDPATGNIEETSEKVRLVRATSRREEGVNGVLPTQLATVLGINSMSVNAATAAALTPIGTLRAGKGEFPIGISKQWFDAHDCGSGETLQLFPTSADSCAGWHTFTTKPASASRLKKLVDDMTDGTFVSPETIAGKTYYEFIGGNVESACPNLEALFNEKKQQGSMTANIPVYDYDCGNVNKERLILGFVRTEITKVQCRNSEGNTSGKNVLNLTVECGIVDEDIGSGGGPADYGFITTSPSMVY